MGHPKILLILIDRHSALYLDFLIVVVDYYHSCRFVAEDLSGEAVKERIRFIIQAAKPAL